MLQIKDIRKKYVTGDLVQTALDGVSLSFRDSELVAILGPSGSGKTTLLNIIGGLDRYDSGDLIINGVSTKKYSDRDWDTYRNHSIGFVFQSYNLIGHQTILANVELALTISGISKSERRRRAKDALEKVGLGEQLHKKPNQLSGGQMQRVAIARALVNNPEILLADEPTGALDTQTGIQVMDLLREVAKDRLVVMVTHNPELAEQYATRIVRVKDGHILSDSNPYDAQSVVVANKSTGKKSSMSFLTSLGLSANNLRTKKGRTIMTAFAGSIGIIGIALILALSGGVSDYIQSIEEETLSEYPLQITSSSMDITSLMTSMMASSTDSDEEDAEITVTQVISSMFSQISTNDLQSLKEYIDSGESGIEEYVKSVEYIYDLDPQIYYEDGDAVRQVNPDTSFGSSSYSSLLSMMSFSVSSFYAMPENEELYESQYDVVAGRWAENYNECVLVLTSDGSISDYILYALGLRDYSELEDILQKYYDGEEIDAIEDVGSYEYSDVLGTTYKVVCAADCYAYDSDYDIWVDKTDNEEYLSELVANGEELTIVGVVRPAEDATSSSLTSGINYTSDLIYHMAQLAAESDAVRAQIANPDVNILTGEEFGEESSDFDLGTMLTIDEDSLTDMFGTSSLDLDSMEIDTSDLDLDTDSLSIDTSSLSLDTDSLSVDMDLSALDLSGIDLSGIDLSSMDMDTLELDMSGLDLSTLLSGLTVDISTDALGQLATDVLDGYQGYVENNAQYSYTAYAEGFSAYLSSEEASAIVTDFLLEKIESSDITVPYDGLTEVIENVMYTDTDTELVYDTADMASQIADTDAIVSAVADYLNDNATVSFNIDTDDIAQLAAALSSGYSQYAAENGLVTTADVTAGLTEYLSSEETAQILTEGIAQVFDLASLEEQLTNIISEYIGEAMSTAMSSYTEALSQSLSSAMGTQITAAVGSMTESMTSQISAAVEGMVSTLMEQITTSLSDSMETMITEMMTEMVESMADSLTDSLGLDTDSIADALSFNMDSSTLMEMLTSMSTATSTDYSSTLASLGYVDFSTPSEIDIYPIDFDSKDSVVAILDDYNSKAEEAGETDKVISYTDISATMMSSVNTIINVVTYVLIAFVAVSLIVSCIMISIITQISVMERTKEIGILRSIGASKNNVSQMFNAETFIIGSCSGLLGVCVTELLIIPINAIIQNLTGDPTIAAVLPWSYALALVVISIVITVISGLVPASSAAKKDPVTALRTE